MDLNEFIEMTVKQIIDGVVETQKYASKFGAEVSARGGYNKVCFDVAFTVVEDKEKKGGAGICVMSLGGG